ncbi:MAG: dihydropteroate synthase [Candidatus Tyrphobacter sp.]
MAERLLAWGERTYVMGIVNVTPDSFSGDGSTALEDAVATARRHVDEGADALDVGGESTRPGHVPVDAATETARVLPVLRALRERFPRVILSIDTSKPAVARAAVEAGADVLNCVRRAPDELLEIAAEAGLGFVAMHNQETAQYEGDVVDAVVRVLEECGRRGVERGIPRERMMLDPGIGFGKTAEQNLRVLRRLDRVVALGFPTLLGASRKSTLGKLTGRTAGDLVAATAATSTLAAAAGIDIVRVHDVAQTRDAVQVADAIYRGWRPVGWTQ